MSHVYKHIDMAWHKEPLSDNGLYSQKGNFSIIYILAFVLFVKHMCVESIATWQGSRMLHKFDRSLSPH